MAARRTSSNASGRGIVSAGSGSEAWAIAGDDGARGVGAIGRVVLVMLLPAAILAGLGMQGLLDWLRSRSRVAIRRRGLSIAAAAAR